jgi:hypothetical protein
MCGCSFASNYGWIRGVWVRGDGAGASRPGAVTASQARENPGGDAGGIRSSGAPGATMQRGRAAPRQRNIRVI